MKSTKSEPPLFLNLPVHGRNEDVIGLGVYAQTLSNAIDQGAQMIAVTSPFGAGKTSTIGLVKEYRAQKKRERIIRVPMWSQLDGKIADTESGSQQHNVLMLHKHLLYQISSQIHPKMGTYISRRLNPNYGLLKVHINKARFWLFGIVALVLFGLGWFGTEHLQIISNLLPNTEKYLPLLSATLKGMGILVAIVVAAKGEVIFSSKGSEKDRGIEADEIMDIYRSEILHPIQRIFGKRLLPGIFTRYIIVIEDLDRSNNNQAIYWFLTQLRKYYMPESSNQSGYRNHVVFVVNIKHENDLKQGLMEKVDSELYAKLFDYVLDLKTIHINDYETVLDNMLQEAKDQLINIGIVSRDCMIDIPGMQWIIRGKKVSIRMIKYRLNKAITTYSSLRERFPKSEVSFEKCAVMAYLTSEYEVEFSKTETKMFDELITIRFERDLTLDDCKNTLNTDDESDYCSAVWELVLARHIDQTYHMYFYNYPKGSESLSADEISVQNAILYNEVPDEALAVAAKRVASSNPTVIEKSLKRWRDLNIPLPEIAYTSEAVYMIALRSMPDKVREWMEELNYTTVEAARTTKQIIKFLHLDTDRKVFCKKTAQEYCEIWEAKFSEELLQKLRMELCREFPREITWYSTLFFHPHSLITGEEIEIIPLQDAIQLVDVKNADFSISIVDAVITKFVNTKEGAAQTSEQAERFLRNVYSVLDKVEIAPRLMTFMESIERIVPDFEDVVFEAFTDTPSKSELFRRYQKLINHLACADLAAKTLSNISKCNVFDGYSDQTINQLMNSGYYLDAVVMSIRVNKAVDFNHDIQEELSAQMKWLLKNQHILLEIRKAAAEHASEIMGYKYLFDVQCPVMTYEELKTLEPKIDVEQIQDLIPVSLVTRQESDMLCSFWNQKFRANSVAYSILAYVAQLPQSEAIYCFDNLDFENAIQYYRLSAKRKTHIKEAFGEILDLQSVEGKLHFLEKTRCMDSEWNKTIAEEIDDNNELQLQYENAVNNCISTKITSDTIRVLCSFPQIGPMSEAVETNLYLAKKFRQYVISKTVREGHFSLETEDTTASLWQTYVDLFVAEDCEQIHAYMVENHAFLECMMKNKTYEGMREEVREDFYRVLQDAACIQNAAGPDYSESFRVRYFSEIKGFAKFDAASSFIDILKNDASLAASDSVYQNTYDKLIDGNLKRKYTNLRKRAG